MAIQFSILTSKHNQINHGPTTLYSQKRSWTKKGWNVLLGDMKLGNVYNVNMHSSLDKDTKYHECSMFFIKRIIHMCKIEL